MAKYKISYAYYKIDKNGRPQGKVSTQKTVESGTEMSAITMLQSQYLNHQIEFKSIQNLIQSK